MMMQAMTIALIGQVFTDNTNNTSEEILCRWYHPGEEVLYNTIKWPYQPKHSPSSIGGLYNLYSLVLFSFKCHSCDLNK